jgi:beta-lactam-binding protein with PASTA domain
MASALSIFRTVFVVLAMFVVMLLFAGLALRLALHGREVPIPDFAGMTVARASEAALHNGLDLNIENKYYSRTVPAGRILSQAPAAGSRVRRGWQVRVTESLGPQQVTIPNVVSEPVREASLDLRRASLDLGTLAHLDAPGDPDMVLAQTPPPDAGLDQPRVNLLLSGQAGEASNSFVMPSFVGMSWPAANRAAIALGLRVAAIGEMTPVAQPAQPPPAPSPAASPAAPGLNGGAAAAAPQIPPPAPVQMVPVGPVTAQSPEAGHRGNRGAVVRLTFGHPSTAAAAPAATPPTAPPSTPPAVPH